MPDRGPGTPAQRHHRRVAVLLSLFVLSVAVTVPLAETGAIGSGWAATIMAAAFAATPVTCLVLHVRASRRR